MSSLIPSKMSTPRLTLLRLTNTNPSHPHVQLFHENWCDPTATAWSLHGATKSLDESRDWMIEHLTKYDNIFYAVFAQPQQPAASEVAKQQAPKIWTLRDAQGDDEAETQVLGLHVGSVSLRLQPSGPVLRPFPPPSHDKPTIHQGKQEEEGEEGEGEEEGGLDLRVIGYAFFASAWGKGYATEANRAMLSAYSSAVHAQKAAYSSSCSTATAGKKYYIEAAVDEDNAGSEKVLRKVGFEKVGWKDEEEKVWLNGAWRGPGYWVYGMYV